MDGWDWADYRQSRQISELQDELSNVNVALHAAHSSTRRLQSELSKATGSLEQRLNRLIAAFDAFVELSDLRMTLGLFDAHARVRHRARQLFGEHPLPGELSDVDGYWLAPALSALRDTADGAPAAAALELARSRDARRAALFQVLGLALLGRPEALTPATVEEVLPEIETEVPIYRRAVWLLAADGQLGTGAREQVVRRGVACLATLEDRQRAESLAAWRRAVRPEQAVTLPKALGQAADLISALDAAERLAVLRHWVAAGLEQGDKPADEVDPIAKQALQLLVDEGSALELPLLSRERELRKVIESAGVTADKGPDSWEAPAGPILTLLRQDIDDAGPGRKAVAIRISAAHILAAGEELAEQARRRVPAEVEARTFAGPVTITRSGPVAESLERAVRRRINTEERHRRKIAYGAAGVGAALVLLALFAGWGWLVPAVAAFSVTFWQLRQDSLDRGQAQRHEAETRASLRADADAAVTAYQEALHELATRRTRLDEDLAALRAALTER